MPIARAVAALGSLALLASGCQATGSDDAQIQKVTYRFISDLSRNDGKAACALMSRRLQLEQARLAGPPAHTCAERTRQTSNSVTSVRGKLSLVSLTIARINITGQSATVAFRGHQPVSVGLVERGGGWVVDRYGL